MRSLYPLILISASSLVTGQNNYFTRIGCFNLGPGASIPIPSNEGKGYPELDGAAFERNDFVEKCFQLAVRLGHNIFATYNKNCYSSLDTVPGGAHAQYGQATSCSFPVYQIYPSLLPQKDSRFFNLGCFKDDSSNPTLVSNEGKGHPELTGTPSNRTNATEKCFQVATRLRHATFAVQNGNCSSSNPAPLGSFARYGIASLCPTSGTGALLTNNVYLLNASSYISSLGCWNDAPAGGFEGVRFLANIPSSVADPVRHCAGIALSRVGPNVTLFALQTVAGNSSILKCSAQRDIVPNGSYSTYGASTTCPSKGTGAPGVNHVYHFKNAPKLEFNWDQLDYKLVGCYRARSVTRYQTRKAFLSVDNCYLNAAASGRAVFYVNAYNCWIGNDFVPGGNYATLGPAPFCRYDGIGDSTSDMDTHQVYVIKSAQPKSLNLWDLPRMGNRTLYPFSSIGCISPAQSRLFRTFDHGPVNITDCYKKALDFQHNLFGIFFPGQCVTSLDIIPGGNYSSQPSSDCPSHATSQTDGSVTAQLFQVNTMPTNPYHFTKSSNWTHLGCFLRSATLNVSANEGKFAILDGIAHTRIDAIRKCYQVAKELRHTEFALERGGHCLSFSNSTLTGWARGSSCLNDQRGDPAVIWDGGVVRGYANLFRVLK